MIRSTNARASFSVLTSAMRSPMRGCAPPLPPAYTFQPSTVPITPTSFMRLSVQEFGQPDTPIFILLGISRDKYLRSICMPRCTLSCLARLQKVVPGQIFTLRTRLDTVYAGSIPSISHALSTSSAFKFVIIMRWLPVNLRTAPNSFATSIYFCN